MPGAIFELFGLLTLAGFAGVGGLVLFTAAIEAFDHSFLVGLLVLCFAMVLFLTAASVGGWGVLEWHRAEKAAPPAASAARDDQGRIKTLQEAFRQPVFIQLMLKVAFFCSTINMAVELIYLRRCHRIFLLVTPVGPPDPHYCDNLAWQAHGINSINPHTRTFLTEMPGTVRAHVHMRRCTAPSRPVSASPALERSFADQRRGVLSLGLGDWIFQHDLLVRRDPASDPGPEVYVPLQRR
jgi:hypothetical protein